MLNSEMRNKISQFPLLKQHEIIQNYVIDVDKGMCQPAVYARNDLLPLNSFPLPFPYVLNPPPSPTPPPTEQLIVAVLVCT